MVKILIDVPEEIDRQIAIHSINVGLKDKRLAIVDILRQHFLTTKKNNA